MEAIAPSPRSRASSPITILCRYIVSTFGFRGWIFMLGIFSDSWRRIRASFSGMGMMWGRRWLFRGSSALKGSNLMPVEWALFYRFTCYSGDLALDALAAHFGEQNRLFEGTLRPLRNFGITSPQVSHWRLAAGSMPAAAITARLSSRSR